MRTRFDGWSALIISVFCFGSLFIMIIQQREINDLKEYVRTLEDIRIDILQECYADELKIET